MTDLNAAAASAAKNRAAEAAAELASEFAVMFLDNAVGAVDDVFGEGYAKTNPRLVSQMVEATAMVFWGLHRPSKDDRS